MCLQEHGGICNTPICTEICNECKSRDCKWKIAELNKQDELKPDSVRIKVFSGNKMLKN